MFSCTFIASWCWCFGALYGYNLDLLLCKYSWLYELQISNLTFKLNCNSRYIAVIHDRYLSQSRSDTLLSKSGSEPNRRAVCMRSGCHLNQLNSSSRGESEDWEATAVRLDRGSYQGTLNKTVIQDVNGLIRGDDGLSSCPSIPSEHSDLTQTVSKCYTLMTIT